MKKIKRRAMIERILMSYCKGDISLGMACMELEKLLK